MYEPGQVQHLPQLHPESTLTTPVNAALESGAWTQSIIWSPKAPFRDFTQLELHEEDIVPEDKPSESLTTPVLIIAFSHLQGETARPRKRIRMDPNVKDKFNLSNDQYYEVSKEGARQHVRQTFGQLVVEHAYPAQKLQLPFVRSSRSVYGAIQLTRTAVQDATFKDGSTVLPSSRFTVPFEH